MASASTPLVEPRAPVVLEETRPAARGGYLPYVVAATTLVAFVPIAITWTLRGTGVITSPWICLGVAVVLSLVASRVGNAYWKKRRGTGDLLFSDLLVWGWLWRRHVERQLAQSTKLLATPEASAVNGDGMSVERRVQLLAQLATAMEAQDAYLTGHSRRVARHASMVSRKMRLAPEEITRVRTAAAIHDVGKLHVPKELLDKPGRLTAEEFEAIKRHAVEGAAMVAPLGDAELTSTVRHHHEHYDGSGYPDGLAGEAIPLGARIIAVADTFDALTSARPYRPAARHKEALGVLADGMGTQLDPEAVRAFLRYYSGNQLVVMWATLAGAAQRALAWLTGESAEGGTLTAGKLASALFATAAVGITAAGSPVRTSANSASVAAGNQAVQRAAAATQPGPVGKAAGNAARAATTGNVGSGGGGNQPPIVKGGQRSPRTPLTSISGVSTTRGGGGQGGSHSVGSDSSSSGHQGSGGHPPPQHPVPPGGHPPSGSPPPSSAPTPPSTPTPPPGPGSGGGGGGPGPPPGPPGGGDGGDGGGNGHGHGRGHGHGHGGDGGGGDDNGGGDDLHGHH